MLGLPAFTQRLFVYGTLINPTVLSRLINRVPHLIPAVALGCQRKRVQGRAYPAMFRHESSETNGFLMQISDDELKAFDEYESFNYERQEIKVVVSRGDAEKHRLLSFDALGPNSNSTVVLTVLTYIWCRSLEMLDGPWDYDVFKKSLPSYLRSEFHE